ncbi:MBL fold metallo-hydrolase [Haloarcula nitratireducens]|uniref:MBL fold metallo-hydrolase n=1 Tax=Haloarcula nitratireducens TaxID=2487749 RepID=A0AAW4PDP5_9EURY|nr:MBL fold metallo-hydrolase [Halomicroarcula nitratireducens]MBX0296054.1 MBL fold metallo-hydrolase [Halomicroarcula nitratireducens]
MAIGDVYEVEACEDVHYVDTGMYDVPEYGSVYVVDAERPALVDTGLGTNYDRILDAMDEIGIAPEELEVIALTHIHLDHAGGAGYLVEECPNATVYVHELGARHLVDPERIWEGTKGAVGDQIEFYVEPKPVPEERIVELTDGDEIDLGDHTFEAVHAPGHAPHQVVFYDPSIDGVFTADAAGIYTPSTDGVHVTTPPVNFDLEQALADVETIRELGPETLLYGHFGSASTADRLDEYAEKLDEWVDAVAEKRAELGDDEAVADHFVETVETPEIWGERKAGAEVAMNVRGVLVSLDRGD